MKKNIKGHIYIFSVCVLALLASVWTAGARTLQQKPTPEELKKLPVYCQIKMKYHNQPIWVNPPEMQYWKKVLGPKGYLYLHHYCYGLNWLKNRINEPNLSERDIRFIYKAGAGELKYVLDRVPMTFPLMPELLLNRGTALAELGKTEEAIASWLGAIKLKPDYEGAYLRLARYLAKLGDTDEARSIIERGLKVLPGSKPLKELKGRLAEKDGKTSDRQD